MWNVPTGLRSPASGIGEGGHGVFGTRDMAGRGGSLGSGGQRMIVGGEGHSLALLPAKILPPACSLNMASCTTNTCFYQHICPRRHDGLYPKSCSKRSPSSLKLLCQVFGHCDKVTSTKEDPEDTQVSLVYGHHIRFPACDSGKVQPPSPRLSVGSLTDNREPQYRCTKPGFSSQDSGKGNHNSFEWALGLISYGEVVIVAQDD